MSDEYQAVGVYALDDEGGFIGYAIQLVEIPNKLRGTHLYVDGEEDQLREDLDGLNHGAEMTHFWPDKDDPEFIALINSPDFMPIEYTEEEVLDDDEVQRMFETGELDPDRDLKEDPVSGNIEWLRPEKLPMVMAKVPIDPAAPQARLRKAAETIALQRMAADEPS